MHPASFEYFAPQSVEETLDLLTRYGEDAKLLAGGHSLIPSMKLRLAQPNCLIDLGQLQGLSGIRLEDDTLVIGAMTVHADVLDSELVREHFPGLTDAVNRIGDVQVRNRGTVGGSVAHADPAADLPVILTALNASFVTVSPLGTRTIAVDDFFVDFFTTALTPDELLTEVRIPLPPHGTGTAYAKLGHPASGYVVVSAGAMITRGEDDFCVDARIAIGGVAPNPLRASAAETDLLGGPLTAELIEAAAAMAAEGADPDDEPYASAEYKRQMAIVYARRAIQAAAIRTGA